MFQHTFEFYKDHMPEKVDARESGCQSASMPIAELIRAETFPFQWDFPF